MAYMSQERKAQIAPAVKAILKRYGVKGSLAVRHHSTLVLNIKSGKLDFIGDYYDNSAKRGFPAYGGDRREQYIQVNPYHFGAHFKDRVILKFLDEVLRAMNVGNHDNSDIQTDYFDVGWYVKINIGQWNKPYVLEA